MGIIEYAAKLRDKASHIDAGNTASCVYNPLKYAWKPHQMYLERFGTGQKRVVFLGINPGPFGMAQSGVPFGEIDAVKNWMGIEAEVGKPDSEHPKRPVDGFDCPKSEVSGRRLWTLMKERYGPAENFFAEHFVANYCPLVFMNETGKNITPDKLPAAQRSKLFRICDTHLTEIIMELKPEFLVGIGKFAEKQLNRLLKEKETEGLSFSPYPVVTNVLHPSPASPHANRGWAEQAVKQLKDAGVW